MKILYVSDLDGTLLNESQQLSSNATKELNELINSGVNFTVSTGRGNSVKRILKDVNFKLPIMILNGTINYDFSKQEFIDKNIIPKDLVFNIINSLKDFKYKLFQIQTLTNDEVKRFQVADWNRESDCLALNVLFPEEFAKELKNILSKIDGIDFFIHKKVYTNGECYCDIVKKNISKASGLKAFKEQYGFDKIIAFGDSENDLPLQEIADEFYAVENAQDIVKQKATGVIESCYNNGVVNFIKKNSKKMEN